MKDWKTHKTVIINGVDVFLFRHHIAKASASRVLKGDARCPWTKNLVDIIAVIQLIIKTRRDLNGFGRVTILNNDQVIRLEKWPPHLKEIKVPDCGDHNVKLIFQKGCWCHRSISHIAQTRLLRLQFERERERYYYETSECVRAVNVF